MKSSPAHPQAGFTLYEILISILIFVIGFLPFFNFISNLTQANSRMRELYQAGLLAQSEMEYAINLIQSLPNSEWETRLGYTGSFAGRRIGRLSAIEVNDPNWSFTDHTEPGPITVTIFPGPTAGLADLPSSQYSLTIWQLPACQNGNNLVLLDDPATRNTCPPGSTQLNDTMEIRIQAAPASQPDKLVTLSTIFTQLNP